MISDKKIKEILFRLESDPEIFKYRLDGYSMYFALRFNIELELRNYYSGIIRTKETKFGYPKNPIRRLRSAYDRWRTFLRHNRVMGSFDKADSIQKSQHIFISTSFVQDERGGAIGFEEIIRHYKSKGEQINFVQRTYLQNLPKKQEYHDTYLPINDQGRVSLTLQELKDLKSLVQFLTSRLDPDFDERFKFYKNQLQIIKYKVSTLTEYLNAASCEYIFCRSLYTEPWVVMAGQRTSVKCVEVQHGVITADLVYYQSILPAEKLGKDTLLLPDFILTIGGLWTDIFKRQGYIYNSENVLTLGTDAFRSYLLSDSDLPVKSSGKILIATQPGLFNVSEWFEGFLQHYYLDLQKVDVSLIFRFHPNESPAIYQKLKERFPAAVQIQNPNEIDLYQAIMESDAVLSGTSMCLYESIALGKMAISLSHLKGNTVPDYIKFVSSHEELYTVVAQVKDEKQTVLDSGSYLELFNPNVLDTFN